jgi:hypothetical protein
MSILGEVAAPPAHIVVLTISLLVGLLFGILAGFFHRRRRQSAPARSSFSNRVPPSMRRIQILMRDISSEGTRR